MGYLLLAFFSVYLLFSAGVMQRDNATASVKHQADSQKQQALGTLRYMNALVDYLYSHPVDNGTLSHSLLESEPPPGVQHRIHNGRIYVYQPIQQGLISAMADKSRRSALLGTVKSRRLLDLRGTDMQVTVPEVIPDGYLVYLH